MADPIQEVDEAPPGRTLNPLLDPLSFKLRLDAEVARIRRSGGFLSLVLIGCKPGPEGFGVAQERVTRMSRRLRETVRAQDVLAWQGANLALLMPDTDNRQATLAARRLLQWAGLTDGQAPDPSLPVAAESAGLATVYGDAEGGAEALLAAAEEAYREADHGQLVASSSLDGRPRILVVDDDSAFAQALADTVCERGWEGHPCSQPADALARVKTTSYAALFVDLVLPGSSGVEILRQALAAHPRRPAVLMSGHEATHQDVLDALSLGPVLFVRKPLSTADLDAALETFRMLLPGAPPR